MPRIAPDLNDQLIWPLTETSGAYRNVGQYLPNDPSTDLSITNSVTRTGAHVFGGNCPQIPSTSNFPSGSSATRNYLSGASSVLITPPITLSFWVYLRSYTSSNAQGLVYKEYRDPILNANGWTSPFKAIGVTVFSTNNGQDWGGHVAIDSSTQAIFTVTDFPIPLGVWSHVGMSYDGTNIRSYLNGCQMIRYSGGVQTNTFPAAALSYTDGTHGYGDWKIGGVSATGSSTKEEPSANIADVRIANVARPLSYFKKVYESGALPLRSGAFTSAQYYKLRAYDLSCPTPTAVVWIDTQISLANAPAFPCSGLYSDPEVLETWYT